VGSSTPSDWIHLRAATGSLGNHYSDCGAHNHGRNLHARTAKSAPTGSCNQSRTCSSGRKPPTRRSATQPRRATDAAAGTCPPGHVQDLPLRARLADQCLRPAGKSRPRRQERHLPPEGQLDGGQVHVASIGRRLRRQHPEVDLVQELPRRLLMPCKVSSRRPPPVCTLADSAERPEHGSHFRHRLPRGHPYTLRWPLACKREPRSEPFHLRTLTHSGPAVLRALSTCDSTARSHGGGECSC
jgi:hypothetical protein